LEDNFVNKTNDFFWMSVEDLEKGYRLREFSPVEVTQAFLDRIDKLNPSWNTYITVSHESALATARKAEKELMSGENLGLLHGIPIAVKDLINTCDIRTTYGSPMFDQYTPLNDATIVKRIKQAGAIILGKTNTDTFAYGVTTENPYYGKAHNPWGINRISGGSSGGSAVAVASGMATLALGSDTAGSIRIPASCCGVVGLKPTFGLVSKYGVMRLSWTLDHVGSLARNAKDIAKLLKVISGNDDLDPFTVEHKPLDEWSQIDLSGLRIGIPMNWFFTNIEPEMSDAIHSTIKKIEDLGAKLVEIEIPNTEKYFYVFSSIGRSEAAYDYESLRHRIDEFPQSMHEWLDDGRSVSLSNYIYATREREKIRQGLISIMKSIDVLAFPSMPMDVPEYNQPQFKLGNHIEDTHNALMRIHYPFNLSGQPAISVPCGLSNTGLPIGLQLAAKHGDDMKLLSFAQAWLTAYPFQHAQV
jgi:aspartyl-tRNA(Asn)/glutamyl-tRNA(Gln) amidotransferase subunit A